MSVSSLPTMQPAKAAVIHSHRQLHPRLSPTHLVFGAGPGPHDEWQSRRARKGRYAPRARRIQDGGKEETVFLRVKEAEHHLKPHLTLDISWWVAVAFTFGSAVWVVNGFLVWFPVLRPQLDTTSFSYAAAALAFIGGTVFEIGSYLMVVEALDRGRETNFGTALSRVLHRRRAAGTVSEAGDEMPEGAKGFVWWGRPLWHDMGYDAAIVQLCAASVFWVATLTGLPGVIPGFYSETSSTAIVDVFYWTPQVVGGTGFILSSVILLLEVQRKWYLPRVLDLGWQIAFWNLVGAVGFTLCGALGYASSQTYESDLSTFWGSWAFLIGSVLQLFEATYRDS
ncbi:hypothetical protein Q5752_004668 [Cryptotrichosporon argae]